MVKPFKRKSNWAWIKNAASHGSQQTNEIFRGLEIISEQIADENKIEEIKKVSFKEGDCIVLLHPSTLSEEALQNLREGLKGFFKIRLGFDVPILVFEESMKFEVLSKE